MRTSFLNVLGFGFGLSLFLIPLSGFSQAPAPDAAAAEPVQYVLEDIQGSNVQVLETGADGWAAGEEGEVLEAGDEIKVGDGSEAPSCSSPTRRSKWTDVSDWSMRVASLQIGRAHV